MVIGDDCSVAAALAPLPTTPRCRRMRFSVDRGAMGRQTREALSRLIFRLLMAAIMG